MDFWGVFEKEQFASDFGSKQVMLNTGQRHSMSLKMVQERAVEIGVNECIFQKYSYDKRYLIAQSITFDVLLTIYDVNHSALLALRTNANISDKEMHQVSKLISGIKRPNLEIRAIGAQNNAENFVQMLNKMHALKPNTLAEIDLFGNNIRHILIDSHTGMPYNLLLQNRIYRPGELVNNIQAQSPAAPVRLHFRIQA
ncbi:MAG: hypothetical protein M1156_00540 [Candidatus Marsarchaeota archaeon]|nr:hypothetical protein [Candidatus Marsarchaeota archaeon]